MEHEKKVVSVKHLKHEFAKVQTIQDKAADKITAFSGSMVFVYLHIFIFAAWIVINRSMDKKGFDPYPFNFLTLVVSLEAIFLSTFVMISQNRQSKLSDLRSELDYEVNVRAEQEICEIKEMLHKLAAQQEK